MHTGPIRNLGLVGSVLLPVDACNDTVLLAPSPKALQSLINICVSFANNHGLVYNEQKTKFMCLKPAVLKNIYVPNVELNGKALELVKRE